MQAAARGAVSGAQSSLFAAETDAHTEQVHRARTPPTWVDDGAHLKGRLSVSVTPSISGATEEGWGVVVGHLQVMGGEGVAKEWKETRAGLIASGSLTKRFLHSSPSPLKIRRPLHEIQRLHPQWLQAIGKF